MTLHRPSLAFASLPKATRSRMSSSRFESTALLGTVESFDDPSQLGAQVFEPVVNFPALGSFLVIVVVFSLLQFRILQVNEAAERRKEALTQLRSIKARELSSADNRPSPEQIQQALEGFEQAIENEESLRTVIPGIRIVAPNASSEEDVRAAKQFLGLDLRTESAVNEPGGLSTGAIGVLVLVGISQVALLYMLSFDPMKAHDVYAQL